MHNDYRPYVPSLVRDWPEHRQYVARPGTMVLADISGFTPLTERLSRMGKIGSEEVARILNLVFAELLTVADELGGDFLKSGGDALLIWFAGSGHATRGAAAAYRMRTALEHIGKIDTIAGMVKLDLTVGVHSGEFNFFLVGATHRELIVTGRAASSTVKVAAVAEPGQILVSAATAGLLEGSAIGAEQNPGFLLAAEPTVGAIPDPAKSIPDSDLDQYVPRTLDGLLGNVGRDGEHRIATVAFLDFEEADYRVERQGGAEFAPILDELVRTIQQACLEFGITFLSSDTGVDGGRIMLTAGVPNTAVDDEERMLLALQRIQQRPLGLPVRAAANQGRVFAADVGTGSRRYYGVIGDAVNMVDRLIRRARPGQVVTTSGMLGRCRTVFKTTPLEPFVPKGKEQPMTPHIIGDAVGTTGWGVGRRLPLVGRDPELTRLRGLLEEAMAGEGAVVEIDGEAGIGKTRLIEELAVRAEQAAVRVSAVECAPYRAGTPYAALRDPLRRLVGIEPHHDEREGGAALQMTVETHAPELLPWLPLIAVPLNVRVPPTVEVDRLDSSFRKERTLDALRDLVATLASRTILLLLEDVQWMDHASQELLEHLLPVLKDHPWLVCATSRTGDLSRRTDYPVERLSLEPLADDAAHALAEELDEDLALSFPELSSAASRGSGNPLFILELVSAASNHEIGELPDTIESLVSARIDQMPPDSRRALLYASVVGRTFQPELVAEALQDAAMAGAPFWDTVRAFVEPADGTAWRFLHALYREVAYEHLPFRRRRETHGRLGEVLENRGAPADLLAVHFARAARHEPAWRYSRIAGDEARSQNANLDAAGFYRQALEAADHLAEVGQIEVAQVTEALGDVLEMAGQYEEAEATYAQALGTTTDRTVRPRLLRKQGLMRERLGNYEDALELLAQGLTITDGAEEETLIERADLEVAYAGVLFRQGSYAECIGMADRAVATAEPLGHCAVLAHAYYLLAHACSFIGDERGPELRTRALPIYEELEDYLGQSRVLNNLGVEAYFSGQWNEAVDYWERSGEAAEAAGDVLGVARAANNIGEILSDQGNLSGAEAAFKRAMRVWRASGYQVGLGLGRMNLGRAAARAGRYREAAELLQAAEEGFIAIGAEAFAAEAQARRVENAVLGDDRDAGRLAAEALAQVSGQEGAAVQEAMLERLLGLARVREGDNDAAVQLIDSSWKRATAADAPFEVAQTGYAMVRLSDRLGQTGWRNRASGVDKIIFELGIENPQKLLPAWLG